MHRVHACFAVSGIVQVPGCKPTRPLYRRIVELGTRKAGDDLLVAPLDFAYVIAAEGTRARSPKAAAA